MANKMTMMMKIRTRNSGVTLVELLVAVTISSVLLIGVGSVYYNSKRTYQVQEEFAQLQEGARLSVKFMVEDIRLAGFMGCVRNNDFQSIFRNFINNTGSPENEIASTAFGVGITGYEATATGPGAPAVILPMAPPATYIPAILPTYLTAPNPLPLPGSDIIIIRYADGNGARLSQNKLDANFSVDDQGTGLDPNNCHPPTNICQGHFLIATDCQKARLFQATTLASVGANINIIHDVAPPAPGNAVTLWGVGDDNVFEMDDTYIFRAFSVAYYIANNPTGEPSLFRLPMQPGAPAIELITGVENMQILYGVDAEKILTDANTTNDIGDGIANSFVPADNVVAANENIVSVRFSLLLRTTNEVSTKSTAAPVAQNYLLAGMDVASGTTVTAPADRRLRKVFTTTVKIRNKGLL